MTDNPADIITDAIPYILLTNKIFDNSIIIYRLYFYTTVTRHDADKPPLTVITVIIACPADTPVTTPELDTVAMRVLKLVHLTAKLEESDGKILAVNVPVDPLFTVKVFALRLTSLTWVTIDAVSVFLLLPSCVVTVIVAVPVEIAVMRPFESTVAIAFEELPQLTFLLVAVAGYIVGIASYVLPVFPHSNLTLPTLSNTL